MPGCWGNPPIRFSCTHLVSALLCITISYSNSLKKKSWFYYIHDLAKNKTKIFRLSHGHDHVCPRSYSNLCSRAVMPCRTSVMVKHRPWLRVRDPGQPAINKHHVSITHGFHVSCFLFFLRRWPSHRHGECQNNGEDTERRDTIMEVKRLSLSYVWQGSVLCAVCVCVWVLRNDRNAKPSALLLSEGWVVKSTIAESFPGTSFSPVWACACKREEIQCLFPFVVLYLLLLWELHSTK